MVGLEDRGLEGVEVLYDDLLGGKPQFVVAQQDALGRLVFRQDEPAPQAPIFDVYLTIDEVLQYIAERELARAVERSGRSRAASVVLDPATGEILALANQPPSTRTATRRQAAPPSETALPPTTSSRARSSR